MKKLIPILLITILNSCTKEEIKPISQAVTLRYTDNGDTISHWCVVTGEDLERFRSYPRYDTFCTGRVQEIIIGDDHCFKKY